MINMFFKQAEKNGVTIELLLTKKCNFFCGHCMYSCSSSNSSKYMSDKILGKVKRQVDFLNSLGLPVIINLVGGEPTLNMKKFKHIFDLVATWNVDLTMSTNGWWLKEEKTTEKFFKIIKPHIREDGFFFSKKTNKRFLVRVSDDAYHKEQREARGLPIDLGIPLRKYLEKSNINVHEERPFIFIQNGFVDTYWVFPNGRGKDVSDLNTVYERLGINGSYCFTDLNEQDRLENIHYNPDGLIEDGCMNGSYYDVGTVDDNILYCILLIKLYKAWRFDIGKKYNCYNCRVMFQAWKMKYLKEARASYSAWNSFDKDKFLEFRKATSEHQKEIIKC